MKHNFFIFFIFFYGFLFSTTQKNFTRLNEILFKGISDLDPYPSFIKNKDIPGQMQSMVDQYNILIIQKKINYLENINIEKNRELILKEYSEEINKNILQHLLDIEEKENLLEKEKEKKISFCYKAIP